MGRVVDGKSGVFTEVGSGQPEKSMLRGWGWIVRELGAYQYHHHNGIRVTLVGFEYLSCAHVSLRYVS